MLDGGLSRLHALALAVCALLFCGGMLATVDLGHFDRLLSIKERSFGKSTLPGRKPRQPSTPVYPQATTIPSDFDINTELKASWGTGAIAPLNGAGPDGVFRYACNAGELKRDDPIAFPAQPGKGPLHQFFGNGEAGAFSNYSSLRQSGNSTCQSRVNRSAYWIPAMFDGVGNVVRPDYVAMQYQRRPIADPKCHPEKDSSAVGICIPLPNGLRYEIGYDILGTSSQASSRVTYSCSGPTAGADKYGTMADAIANCPSKPASGQYNRLGVTIDAPQCWDGKNLDSADHRSHMAYASSGWLSSEKCPSTHPFYVPWFTMTAWYTVDANLESWHFSSDEARPGVPAGTTFHAGWFGGWDSYVMGMWTQNCIDKRLNCAGGDLGNGKQIKTYAGFSDQASPRLVPVPDAPRSKVLVSEGDSISVTWGGNHTGIYANLRVGAVTQHGLAVGGSSLDSVIARSSNATSFNPQVLTVLIGANDLANYGSPEAYVQKLYTYTDPLRARGIKVAVGTILPQYVPSNAAYTTKFNTYRASVNGMLRSAVGTRIDAVVDFAADPEMGVDTAAAKTSLYKDGVHPTDGCGMGCGGQGKLAVIYQKAVDRLMGL